MEGSFFRLHANDADFGIGFLERAADAGDEAAAADGYDDGFEVWDLFEQLEGDGALAADDVGVVEGMDEGSAFFDAAAECFFAGLVVACAVQNYICAEGPGARHLDLRRGQRHDDLCADAERRGVEGDALRMVAGAGGDDSALALDFIEREQLVERAALFEGAGTLQVFQLEVNGQPGQLREMMREMAGRDVDRFADAGAGRLNAGEGYGLQNDLLECVGGWWDNPPMRQRPTKNHQPHPRVVACFTCSLPSLVRQAPFPACDGAANSNGGRHGGVGKE